MRRPTPDEYKEFGVSPEARPEEVKRRYYHLAAGCHPDFGHTGMAFSRVNLLYRKILAASKVCKACGGTGRIKKQAGFSQVAMVCRECNGKGAFEV